MHVVEQHTALHCITAIGFKNNPSLIVPSQLFNMRTRTMLTNNNIINELHAHLPLLQSIIGHKSVSCLVNQVLYCIVLYCIVLYCIVLYCIVLYCIVLYCIVLYCMVKYGITYCNIKVVTPSIILLFLVLASCATRRFRAP
jgi:hypothetical protein